MRPGVIFKFMKARGAISNPAGRFEKFAYVPDPDVAQEESPSPQTQFFKDTSRSAITYNDSPDVGFSASLNPYRGCEHGCVYCYARPTHEYLGLSAGLDFETRIMVKKDAPELLRKELSSPKWRPQVLAMSGVTDCYQPIERHLKLTRRCLEVLVEFRNPVAIITKNFLVTRDIDLLKELASYHAAAVFISITTLDDELRLKMEPRTSSPRQRLKAIERLAEAGIPVGVMVAPIIPGLNDHEIPKIIEKAVGAGAQSAGHVLVRLPYGVKDLFTEWLEENFPDRKQKVLHRIQEVRGGKLNDPRFGSRMRGEGTYAREIHELFTAACKKYGILGRSPELSTGSFRIPERPQMELFG
jgi:DNA repair photolyase